MDLGAVGLHHPDRDPPALVDVAGRAAGPVGPGHEPVGVVPRRSVSEQPVRVDPLQRVAAVVVGEAGHRSRALDDLHDVVVVVVRDPHGVAEAVDHGRQAAAAVVDHHVGRRAVGRGHGGDAVGPVLVVGLPAVVLDLGQHPADGVVAVAADHDPVRVDDAGQEAAVVELVGDVARGRGAPPTRRPTGS